MVLVVLLGESLGGCCWLGDAPIAAWLDGLLGRWAGWGAVVAGLARGAGIQIEDPARWWVRWWCGRWQRRDRGVQVAAVLPDVALVLAGQAFTLDNVPRATGIDHAQANDDHH
jgi:hypothetical protein